MKPNKAESDYDLIRAELKITDPYNQDGLIDHIPEDEKPVEILNTYSYEEYPDKKAYCAICKSHRHQEGLTSKLTKGALVMVGSKCAADHYEQSWAELKKTHDQRTQRQSLLLDFDTLAPKVSLISKELCLWKIKMERFIAFRKRFINTLNPLYELLSQEAIRGSDLVIYERIEGSSFQQELGKNSPEYQKIPIHYLEGRMFFNNLNPEIVLSGAIQLMYQIAEFAQDTDGISNNKLSRLRNKYLKMIDDLESLKEMHQAPIRFFSHKNLLGVASWATQSKNIPGTYSVNGISLIWDDHDVSIALPNNYPSLDRRIFDLLDKSKLHEQPKKKARKS